MNRFAEIVRLMLWRLKVWLLWLPIPLAMIRRVLLVRTQIWLVLVLCRRANPLCRALFTIAWRLLLLLLLYWRRGRALLMRMVGGRCLRHLWRRTTLAVGEAPVATKNRAYRAMPAALPLSIVDLVQIAQTLLELFQHVGCLILVSLVPAK